MIERLKDRMHPETSATALSRHVEAAVSELNTAERLGQRLSQQEHPQDALRCPRRKPAPNTLTANQEDNSSTCSDSNTQICK